MNEYKRMIEEALKRGQDDLAYRIGKAEEAARDALSALGISVCHFCGKMTPDGPGEDWIPSYVATGEDEVCEPVCPVCVSAHLVYETTTDEYFTK